MPFQIPETVTGLTVEQLAELHTQAQEAFDAIAGRDPADISDTDLAELETLADFIETVRAHQDALQTAQQQRADRLAGLRDRVQPTEPDPDTDEVEEPSADPDDPAGTAAAAGTTAAASTSTQTTAVTVAEPAPTVLASLPSVGRAARRAPRPALPAGRGARVVAAADLPEHTNGQELGSLGELAEALTRRIQGFPRAGTTRLRMRNGVARIHKPYDDALVADGRRQDDDVLAHATAEARLPGASLLAAGGWCAPSETVYELFAVESSEGMLDLPEVQVQRAGLRFNPGPDFAAIYSQVGFHLTEAQAIAGQQKPIFKVPCSTTWSEARLEPDGVAIEANILQDTAWPELTQRYVLGGMVAHDHKLNATAVAALAAGSTPVDFTAAGAAVADVADPSATTAVLGVLELAVEDYLARHRMSRAATLELVVPLWLRGLIRTDLSRRTGQPLASVTDGQIDAHFAARRVRPQYVYDWQDAFVAPAGTGMGGAVALRRWPGSVGFLLYAAGTWVRGSKGVVSLDAVYDSANLPDNEFIALFSEESHLVAKYGHDSRLYTVPVCPTGATAAAVAYTCPAPAAAAAAAGT